MNIKPTIEKIFPSGVRGGQCFEFLHKLANFGSVGNSLAEKIKYFNQNGIPISQFNGNYRLGDILLTNESTKFGHGAMVNSTLGGLRLTESNYSLNEKVNHSRMLAANSSKILAVLRPNNFYFQFPPLTSQVQLTVKILMNNQPIWNSMLSKMAMLQNWFWQYSNQRIQLIMDYKNVNVKGWPTLFYGSDPRTEQISEQWYDQNILPLGEGANIVIFVVKKSDWKGVVFDQPNQKEIGYCYEPHYPIKITLIYDENDDYPPSLPNINGFAKFAAHEISHGLYGICSARGFAPGIDLTHNHFYGLNGNPMKFEDIFRDFDYFDLQNQVSPG